MSSTLGKFVVKIRLQQQYVVWPTRAISLSARQASHRSNGYLELDTDCLQVWRIPTTTQQWFHEWPRIRHSGTDYTSNRSVRNPFSGQQTHQH